MDLRRERKKGKRFAVTAAALSVVILTVGMVTANIDDSSISPVEGADDRATDASQGITALFNKENAADEFSYEIKRELSFEDGDSVGKLLLKNPSVNRYIMYLEIKTDDELVLRTGNIAPGQMIKEAKLDIELSKGEYQATAYIYAVDPESYKTAGMVTQPITIKING